MKKLSILLFFLLPFFSFNQNPFDECSGAFELTLTTPADCPNFSQMTTSLSLDNIGATDSDPSQIFDNCNFNDPCADIWIRFTAVSNALDIFLTGELSFPRIGIYLDSGCDNLVEVDCAFPNNADGIIDANFQLVNGQSYFLLVSGSTLNDQGLFDVSFTPYDQSFNPPANDDCQNAEVITIPSINLPCPDSDTTSVLLCGDLYSASFSGTSGYDFDDCNGNALSFTGKNAWYSFTSVSDRLRVHLEHDWSKANIILLEDGNCVNMPLVDCTEEEGNIEYTFNIISGVDYKLAIAAPDGIVNGNFDLLLEAFNSCISSSADECADAETLVLLTPPACPVEFPVTTNFVGSNVGATATVPYPLFTGCNPGGAIDGPAAEVWFQFQATSNVTKIELSSADLDRLNMAVFVGDSCDFLQPIECASGVNQLNLTFNSDLGTNYYLMVSGEDINDQGVFSMIFTSSNNCNTCLLGDDFTVVPPPINGTYAAGTTVSFCYEVNQWDVTGTIEWLHSVTLDLGSGWDASSLTPTSIPQSCGGDGQWQFFPFGWAGCNTGQFFGPGFAYDSASGVGCGGSPFDGDPGNNWGDGQGGCSNINPGFPFEFCWEITVDDCNAIDNGADLSIEVNVWSDGDSGSWTQVGCNSGTQTNFLASAICCVDSLATAYIVEFPFCFQPTGVIYAEGGSSTDFYNIYIFDQWGSLVGQEFGVQGGVNFEWLQPGEYILLFENINTSCTQNIVLFLDEVGFIDVFAIQQSSCDGFIILEAFAFSDPQSPFFDFFWYGPNGFFEQGQQIIVQEPGNYTVEAISIDGCVAYNTITAVEDVPVDVSIAGDTEPCVGYPTALTANANGAVAYSWSTGETTQSITVNLSTPATISVTVTNVNGCTGEASIFVDPQEATPPEFTITPLDSINPPGGLCPSNTFLIEYPSDYFAIFENVAGDSVIDSNPFQYTIVEGLSSDTLFFFYEGPAPSFCPGQDTLILEPYYPELIEEDTLMLCQGVNTLSIDNALPTDTILWSTGANSPSINIIVDQMATYSVTVTRGCTVVDSVQIIPNPEITVDLGPDQFFCEPLNTSLTANASGGTAPLEFEWLTSDGSQSDSSSIDISPVIGVNEYIVIVTDSLGCSATDTILITISSIPPPIVSQTNACEGEVVVLEVLPNSYAEYLWSNGDFGPVISVSDAGTYCVTVTDINGCYAETCIDVFFEPLPDPVDIFCNASLTNIEFAWVNDPSLDYQVNVLTGQTGILNGSTFFVDGLTFGQSVTIELAIINSSGCVTFVTQTCTTQDCPDIDIQITPVPDICLTANTTPITLEAIITGAIGIGTSSWSGPGIIDAMNGIFDPTAAGPGIHTVVFTYEEGGCMNSAAINIQIDESILDPIITCSATTTSVLFSWNDVVGAAAYSVNVLSGQSGIIAGNTYVVDGLSPGDEVCIEVIADPANSCDPVSATLCCITESCPDVIIDVEDTYEVCEDDAPFQIPYTLTGGDGTGVIEWTGPCIDNNGVFDPSLCGPGVYTVLLSYIEDPCVYQEPIVVFIGQKPSASFAVSATEVCIEESLIVNYTGNATPSANFSWDFDGGVILAGQGFGPFEVQWSTAGTRTISLTVEEDGCISEVFTQTVEVIETIGTPIISCAVTTSSIEFSWNPIAGVTGYEVTVNGNGPILIDFTNFVVDGLNPDEAVSIQVVAVANNICGNTAATLTCITLPCPDIIIDLSSPYPTLCLSDEDTPDDFLLNAVISGGNGSGNEMWSGNGIIDPIAGVFSPIVAGIGTHEIVFTYTEDNCSYQESITIEIASEYFFENINIICSDNEESYFLSLDIITPDGVIPFESDPVNNGQTLDVSIPNADGCGNPFFYSTTRECDCLTYAGTLDFAIANQCGLPMIEVTHNGDEFLVEDDILRFILHSNNGNVLGEIFAISETPNFMLEGDLEEGVVYYVSAVAGNTSSFETLNLDDPCLSVSAPQAVVFSEAIDLSVSQDTFICSGESYALEASFNNLDSLVWSPATGLSCVTCTNPVAAPSVSTTYTVTAYNAAGCTEEVSVNIYVDEMPNFLPNEPIAVCPGGYVDICLPDALSYEWSGPGNYFSIDQCLVWPNFDPVYAGIYTIEIQISPNCTIIDQLELFATPEQTVNFLTPDFAACPNEVFTLSADIEGAISYRWSPTENVTDNQAATTNAYTTTPTVFILQTLDQYGCEAIFTVDVTNATNCEIDGDVPLDDFTSGNDPQQLVINQSETKENITIFPNPALNTFNIVSPKEMLSVEIFDINGQKVYQDQPLENRLELNASPWSAGTYLVRVQTMDGIENFRLIKVQE